MKKKRKPRVNDEEVFIFNVVLHEKIIFLVYSMPEKTQNGRENRIKGDSEIVLVLELLFGPSPYYYSKKKKKFVMSSYLTYNEADIIHCNCLVKVVVAGKKSVHVNVNEGHRQ